MKIPSSLRQGQFFAKILETVLPQSNSASGSQANSQSTPSSTPQPDSSPSPQVPPFPLTSHQPDSIFNLDPFTTDPFSNDPWEDLTQPSLTPASQPQVSTGQVLAGQPLATAEGMISSSSPAQPAPQSAPQPPIPHRRLPPKRHPRYGLPLLPLFLTPAVLAVGAGVSMFTVPKMPDCRQPGWLMTDGNRLYCANQAARSGNLPALTSALALVSGWSKDHPLYNQANNLAEEWSISILMVARNHAKQGNFQRAKELAQLIPNTVSSHQEAQQLYSFWDTNADEGKRLFQAAQSALKQSNWELARANAKMLMSVGSSRWQAQAQKLLEIVAVEEVAWNQLVRAEDLARYESPSDLVEAIKLLQKLTSGTAAYQEAQKRLKEWHQKLIEFALARQQAGDIAGATELLSQVAPDTAKAAGVQDLMQLGKAESAAKQDNLWGYLQAVALSQQIPAQTTVSSLAETQRQNWQQQVQNRAQMQLANWLASSQNWLGYRLAVGQANLIAANQPQHQQSREAVNRWQQQIGRIEDQPYFNAAMALGQQKKFQQAIQTAQLIAPQRPLYQQAQQQIWAWQGELQAVVDRPILDRAEGLANIGEYYQAISLANKIGSDRVLFREAQDKVYSWQRRIDEIEAARRCQL
jgi:hypothetical protein